MTKSKKEDSFDRKKLMEKEVENLGFKITMDAKSPGPRLLDEKPKGRKKTIPLTIKLVNTPLGPKSHTYYVTNWKSIGSMNIDIEVNALYYTGTTTI